MPMYEYRCDACGNIFEELARQFDAPPPCPSCKSLHVSKLLSVSSTCVPGGFANSTSLPPMGGCGGGSCGGGGKGGGFS